MERDVIKKSISYGLVAALLLLGLYFLILTLVSGWSFAQQQFGTYWYFISSLVAGFGIQIGLYAYLKSLISAGRGAGKVVGITGATSTAAMISCCTHYLANLVPVLGITGAVTFVAQYQVELFWVGILLNLAGIVYMANKVLGFKRSMKTA